MFGRATITLGIGPHSSLIFCDVCMRYGDGAGNIVEENSSIFSLCTSCLQCFDTVGWVAGRASSL